MGTEIFGKDYLMIQDIRKEEIEDIILDLETDLGYSQIEVYHPETGEVYGVLILTREGEVIYSERPFQDEKWKKRLGKFLFLEIIERTKKAIPYYETNPDNQRIPGCN